jgi:hypothetical protein
MAHGGTLRIMDSPAGIRAENVEARYAARC